MTAGVKDNIITAISSGVKDGVKDSRSLWRALSEEIVTEWVYIQYISGQ